MDEGIAGIRLNGLEVAFTIKLNKVSQPGLALMITSLGLLKRKLEDKFTKNINQLEKN